MFRNSLSTFHHKLISAPAQCQRNAKHQPPSLPSGWEQVGKADQGAQDRKADFLCLRSILLGTELIPGALTQLLSNVPIPALLPEPAGKSAPCHSTSQCPCEGDSPGSSCHSPAPPRVPGSPPRSPGAPTGREGRGGAPLAMAAPTLFLLFSPAADRECPKFYTLKPREETGSAPQLEIKQART